MANEKSQNVQDVFLNHVRKNKTPVTVFLVNGVKLQGIITWFDNFSVLLRRDGHTQLVYKHAISTVMPGAPIQLFDATQGGGRRGAAREIATCREATVTARTLPGRRDRHHGGPTRAAVILPWERPAGRRRRRARTRTRAAEARLAEAVGLAASIGLVVVHTAIVPLRERRPAHAAGRGPGRGAGQAIAAQRVDGRRRRCGAVARAAAQPGARLGLQGDRPHRPDPRHLRRARRDARKARCRSSWRIWTTSAPGWCGPGPIWSASAAASASSAAPARRRSRPTAG